MIDSGKDGGVCLTSKHAGDEEGILAHQPLKRVEHPNRVAHASDDLGVREKRSECRHAATPRSVSVKHELMRVNIAVIAIENPAKDIPTLLLVEKYRMFLGSSHCAEKLVK